MSVYYIIKFASNQGRIKHKKVIHRQVTTVHQNGMIPPPLDLQETVYAFNCSGSATKKTFRRSSSKTSGASLSLSFRRAVGRSNVLVRLTITGFSVCSLFFDIQTVAKFEPKS